MAIAKRSSRKRALQQRTRKSDAQQDLAPWFFHQSNGLRILKLTPFHEIPWVVHGFSTREGGASLLEGAKVLNLSFMPWDSRQNVIGNRRRFQSALQASGMTPIPLKQTHSDIIQFFSTASSKPRHGDGSLTNASGLLLSVQTADCVSILLVDPKKRAVAAVHAGWRGTLARIAQKAVGRMCMEFGSEPSHVLAALGPSIGPCCYEVGSELVTKFTAQFADAAEYFDEPRSGEGPNPLQWLNMMPPGHQPPPPNVHLDLRKANRSQLIAAGVSARNVFAIDLCTACRTDLFFSYRREGPRSGRLLSVIGIR